jgi:hypothetical protein
MPNRKIISFNVGSTHFMHFNRADRVTKGETVANKKKRSNLIKQMIGQNILNSKANFLCIQEGFTEVIPRKYGDLTKVADYTIPHGIIAEYNTSFLSTYVNLEKYDAVENKQIDVDYKAIYPRKPCKTQVIEITDKKTGKEFILVNFHGLGHPDTKLRLPLLNFVKNFVETNYPRKEVVIVGDINTNLRKSSGDAAEIEFARSVRETTLNDFEIYPKSDKVKSSYHRYILEEDGTITNKPKSKWYDTLDYCLIKSREKYSVNVKRVPNNFTKVQVPYETLADGSIIPNFEEFPSDHTLNIFDLKRKERFSRHRTIRSKSSNKNKSKRTKSMGNKPSSSSKKNSSSSSKKNSSSSSKKHSSSKKRRGSF